ncbi:MAG TPA: M23 family metallopeptidase [Polyangia bacterium]|nr:M23 family metallopeptidase [Polyangia bacterium]
MPRPSLSWLAAWARSVGTRLADLARRFELGPRARRAAVFAGLVLVRLALLGFAVVATFVLVTALAGRTVQSNFVRWLWGALVVIAVPLALQGRILQLAHRWTRLRVPGGLTFVTGFDLLLLVALALGGGRNAGQALRRHGDWFLGMRTSHRTMVTRAIIGFAAAELERFELPPEMRSRWIPPGQATQFGPCLPGQSPPPAEPVHIVWLHPLAGPIRVLPLWESRRFGAVRGHPSPDECERGHCGVDLAAEIGQPVYAVFDGVVERVERNEKSGGRAGRYVRVGHEGGAIVSRYIHLDHIRIDLKEGDHVVAGEPIAQAGRTGVIDSDTHLHFALSLRPGGRAEHEMYEDPEPYLRQWQLTAGAPWREQADVPPPHRAARKAR